MMIMIITNTNTVVIFRLFVSFFLFTDIDNDFPSHHGTPDFFFPVAQADITECSTYAVICRLKSSPIYTITPSGGLFSHPDYPGVSIKVPKKAVPPKAKFPLELKVGMLLKRGTRSGDRMIGRQMREASVVVQFSCFRLVSLVSKKILCSLISTKMRSLE